MELAAGDAIRAWKPGLRGVREVLHATFGAHAYPRHTHDDWTVFLVDRGAIRYGLDRHEREAAPRMVSVLPPGVAHDGRPATPAGYTKRVLYVDTTVLPESLIGAAVDGPAIADAQLVADLDAVHAALECPDDALEAETRFASAASRIRGALGEPDASPRSADRRAAERLRDALDAHVFEPITLAGAAAEAGWSAAHAAQAFSATFGISPHAYVVGRRLDAARDRILAGRPLADVATEVGFFDQAHLTRQFQRFLGTTPRRYRTAGAA
jgi:AraC-like DNA-binding protein